MTVEKCGPVVFCVRVWSEISPCTTWTKRDFDLDFFESQKNNGKTYTLTITEDIR